MRVADAKLGYVCLSGTPTPPMASEKQAAPNVVVPVVPVMPVVSEMVEIRKASFQFGSLLHFLCSSKALQSLGLYLSIICLRTLD